MNGRRCKDGANIRKDGATCCGGSVRCAPSILGRPIGLEDSVQLTSEQNPICIKSKSWIALRGRRTIRAELAQTSRVAEGQPCQLRDLDQAVSARDAETVSRL